MRGVGPALLLASVLGAGCCGGNAVVGDGRIEREIGGVRFGQTLNRVPEAKPDLVRGLAAATTVNVDAPGLEPAAEKALPSGGGLAEATSGGEGVLVAASETGAAFAVDGYPPEKIGGAASEGWVRAVKRLAPGVHAIRVEKQGFFPVETQVLVRPAVYEVVAVRLGKVVMRPAGGMK